jgi:hypothetical protein
MDCYESEPKCPISLLLYGQAIQASTDETITCANQTQYENYIFMPKSLVDQNNGRAPKNRRSAPKCVCLFWFKPCW